MKNLLNQNKSFILAMLISLCLGRGKLCLGQSSPISDCNASFTHEIVIQNTSPLTYLLKVEANIKNFTQYEWDFGDGTQDTGRVATHHYSQAGKYYYVTLKVYSPTVGLLQVVCEDKKSQWISLNTPDNLCVANVTHFTKKDSLFVQDKMVYMPLIYDGITVSRTWDWGDGSYSQEGQTATHVYSRPGKYLKKLTKNAYQDPCYNIRNCQAIPFLLCSERYEYEIEIGEGNDFTCIASIAHVDSGLKVNFYDRLMVDHFRNDVLEKYWWNFGDGNIAEGKKVNHEYSQPGTYEVILTKSMAINPCPVQPGGVQCLGLPYEVCRATFKDILELKGKSELTTDLSLSNDLDAIDISLYPNPAQDRLHIDVKQTENELFLRIFDQSGKKIREISRIKTGLQEVDIMQLDNGLYFYSVLDQEKTLKNGKLVIKK